MINSWRAAIKTFLRESSNFFFFLSLSFFFFPFAFLENLELEIANPSFYVLRRKKLLHLMTTENVLKVVRPLRNKLELKHENDDGGLFGESVTR